MAAENTHVPFNEEQHLAAVSSKLQAVSRDSMLMLLRRS